MIPTDNEIVERLARPLRHPIDDQFGGIALREAKRLLPTVQAMLLEAREAERSAAEKAFVAAVETDEMTAYFVDRYIAISNELAALKEK